MTIIKYEKNAAGDDIAVDDLVYHSKSKQPLTTNNLLKNQQNSNILSENVKENDINIANEKVQDLTEQWKKGELETGWYYVKNEFGNIFVSEYSKGYDNINERIEKDFFTEDSDITEIICEVPSYEKYKCLETGIILANSLIKNTEEENKKLKELLKECKPYVMRNVVFTTVNRAEVVDLEKNELLTKIDEVLK